jgi:hypothetical protein
VARKPEPNSWFGSFAKKARTNWLVRFNFFVAVFRSAWENEKAPQISGWSEKVRGQLVRFKDESHDGLRSNDRSHYSAASQQQIGPEIKISIE